MIKAKELRIGNLVYVGTDENELPVPCKITALDRFNIYWNGNETSVNFIEPIPITPEWLEKCGFVFKIDEGDTPYESWIHSTCEAFILWNFNDEHWIFDPADQMGIDQSHFKYIHQLQNLYYALTGEELNVDN